MKPSGELTGLKTDRLITNKLSSVGEPEDMPPLTRPPKVSLTRANR